MNDSISRLLAVTRRFLFNYERTLVEQPEITGYRQLTEAEAALMNQIKAKGIEIETLIAQIGTHLSTQAREPGDSHRWVAISRTHFQQGLMALTRAVAQPTSF